jgi:hypothetical protein
MGANPAEQFVYVGKDANKIGIADTNQNNAQAVQFTMFDYRDKKYKEPKKKKPEEHKREPQQIKKTDINDIYMQYVGFLRIILDINISDSDIIGSVVQTDDKELIKECECYARLARTELTDNIISALK